MDDPNVYSLIQLETCSEGSEDIDNTEDMGVNISPPHPLQVNCCSQ